MNEHEQKWTIRGVDPAARDAVEEIRAATGVPFGRLITEAIWTWYDGLDEEDPVPIYRPAA
jgi:hypothetical protein